MLCCPGYHCRMSMVPETICVGPHRQGNFLQVYLAPQPKRITWMFRSRMRGIERPRSMGPQVHLAHFPAWLQKAALGCGMGRVVRGLYDWKEGHCTSKAQWKARRIRLLCEFHAQEGKFGRLASTAKCAVPTFPHLFCEISQAKEWAEISGRIFMVAVNPQSVDCK